jgi:hypothetical protein
MCWGTRSFNLSSIRYWFATSSTCTLHDMYKFIFNFLIRLSVALKPGNRGIVEMSWRCVIGSIQSINQKKNQKKPHWNNDNVFFNIVLQLLFSVLQSWLPFISPFHGTRFIYKIYCLYMCQEGRQISYNYTFVPNNTIISWS